MQTMLFLSFNIFSENIPILVCVCVACSASLSLTFRRLGIMQKGRENNGVGEIN